MLFNFNIITCSTLNLAEQCLSSDFLRQLRALGLVKKTLVLLKDTVSVPVSSYN